MDEVVMTLLMAPSSALQGRRPLAASHRDHAALDAAERAAEGRKGRRRRRPSQGRHAGPGPAAGLCVAGGRNLRGERQASLDASTTRPRAVPVRLPPSRRWTSRSSSTCGGSARASTGGLTCLCGRRRESGGGDSSQTLCLLPDAGHTTPPQTRRGCILLHCTHHAHTRYALRCIFASREALEVCTELSGHSWNALWRVLAIRQRYLHLHRRGRYNLPQLPPLSLPQREEPRSRRSRGTRERARP